MEVYGILFGIFIPILWESFCHFFLILKQAMYPASLILIFLLRLMPVERIHKTKFSESVVGTLMRGLYCVEGADFGLQLWVYSV